MWFGMFYPLLGLQSPPLQEPELLPLLAETLQQGSLLLGAAGVRLVQSKKRHVTFLIIKTKAH